MAQLSRISGHLTTSISTQDLSQAAACTHPSPEKKPSPPTAATGHSPGANVEHKQDQRSLPGNSPTESSKRIFALAFPSLKNQMST